MNPSSATQQFVPIEKIRDGIITLKNGELRAILMTNSLNLSLKGQDEQLAILSQFQNFFNSLEFPVQLFIQSRRLNIKPYITLLEEREKEVREDLIKLQIREYNKFIKSFTDNANIMTKHFFVTVPYLAPTTSGGGMFPFGDKKDVMSEENRNFETARMQLEQRLSVVSQGLSRFGVRSQKLNTEEVVELFYKIFNPSEQDHSAPKLTKEMMEK